MTNAIKNENLVEEFKPYEDKWVALVNDKVVAAGGSPEEVKENAERKGYDEFVYHLVPSFSKTYIFGL
jgi:hypothetical protein